MSLTTVSLLGILFGLPNGNQLYDFAHAKGMSSTAVRTVF